MMIKSLRPSKKSQRGIVAIDLRRALDLRSRLAILHYLMFHSSLFFEAGISDQGSIAQAGIPKALGIHSFKLLSA